MFHCLQICWFINYATLLQHDLSINRQPLSQPWIIFLVLPILSLALAIIASSLRTGPIAISIVGAGTI